MKNTLIVVLSLALAMSLLAVVAVSARPASAQSEQRYLDRIARALEDIARNTGRCQCR